ADLGFSEEHRRENIRRIGEMVRLFLDSGVVALTAFISPFSRDREVVRGLVTPPDFLEIYCRCPIEVCESRDIKGLYRKARAGEIAEFTGISSPYEEPSNPDLVLDTDSATLEACKESVLALLAKRGVIAPQRKRP
ncbi:MAG: adenylyl-sulfate kinase, partial [Acidiferrobacterales bacterium]